MNTEPIEAVLLMLAVTGSEVDWPELRWCLAVPNGVSDYVFPIERGGFVGLAIELK